ncbi:MAG: hypothetical protein KA120_00535 [Candidatus Goldbacteria bacterium]|nr:hypothetical protein [Candidatus Goldiibacteriota bacterium]
MGEAKEKYQFSVYAYVLMSNYYHFLADIKLPNMSQAMQYIDRPDSRGLKSRRRGTDV